MFVAGDEQNELRIPLAVPLRDGVFKAHPRADGRRVHPHLARARLRRGDIQLCTTCTGTIGEMGAYIWDDKASQRGEEKPVKQSDHGLDALRYYVNSLPDWRLE